MDSTVKFKKIKREKYNLFFSKLKKNAMNVYKNRVGCLIHKIGLIVVQKQVVSNIDMK